MRLRTLKTSLRLVWVWESCFEWFRSLNHMSYHFISLKGLPPAALMVAPQAPPPDPVPAPAFWGWGLGWKSIKKTLTHSHSLTFNQISSDIFMLQHQGAHFWGAKPKPNINVLVHYYVTHSFGGGQLHSWAEIFTNHFFSTITFKSNFRRWKSTKKSWKTKQKNIVIRI